MPIVWLVSLKRFLREYNNHVNGNDVKEINWFVDEKQNIRMYIEQTNGSNIYCYIHYGDSDTLPNELKMLLNERGGVLGMEGLDDGYEDIVEQKVDDIATRLKFNLFKGVG